MKTPKFLSKFSAVLSRPKKAQPPKPQKRLQASARAARPSAMDDYEDEEPTTKLSSAFIVVLILHVVAVGGIYAFNSIKASRRDRESLTTGAPATQSASAAKAPAATDSQPAAPAHQPVAQHSEAASAPAANKPAGRTYEIKANDNLTKIALAFNVLPSQIMEANHLKEGAVLKPGQTITIPASKAPAAPAPEAAKTETAKTAQASPAATAAAAKAPGTYVVKKSDTFTSIAKATGVSVDELTKANKNVNPTKLQLGQILKIPKKN